MSEVLPVDSSSIMMSVCVPQSHSTSPGPDVANRGSPLPTPPTSLSLRSSHNQLLNCDVIKQGASELRGSATPPKCRKKYALTNIQSAMGLGEPLLPAGAPSSTSSTSSSSSSASSANPKLAKNGANQLRKAAEQNDLNKNVTAVDPTDGGEDESDGCNNVPEKPEGKETKAPPPRSKSLLDYYASDPPDPPKEDDPALPLLAGTRRTTRPDSAQAAQSRLRPPAVRRLLFLQPRDQEGPAQERGQNGLRPQPNPEPGPQR
ncbi:hypothetical protein ANANG_G00319170 [Anguilla anguilla]|uniref:Uncharacterized protein n=1 Tax=Anguilla anguilla TaxID=7936 RepID=A0A9D3LIQ4_ANGAN|nr:hypothetical protein ANANG_G00319170 [Anguilla anguilla]